MEQKKSAFLVGVLNHEICGPKLPSNRQVLSFLFFNTRVRNLSLRESSKLVIRECFKYWEKAGIPMRQFHHCSKKLSKLYLEWKVLKKNEKKTTVSFKQRESKFADNLDNLYDIAHANALKLIKNESDRHFLIQQRKPGRKGRFVYSGTSITQTKSGKICVKDGQYWVVTKT